MKVFFAYQGKQDKHFLEFNVSSSLTVSEFIDFKSIRNIISSVEHEIILAVNSEILDGIFKPYPHKYRLKEGERVELLRPLTQDPKERRISKT
ncbi:RnfH family protein [Gammaproteobacteria bacterium]|mgnify:CR=1 FL=1|jgi:putative ubiquitin-RnfH superfamily antitoxin RatB of RatAB toxin-antitoxin module|nr:RnfH family protein [Gammaproteobacteria bacterium]MDA8982182.1 RnfH family protein [Gammaproteobacteria bacterium]MDA9142962.1 RnfH family protein [Gammaproteobacteria bacterium]MDA9997777.1 RnfH family protein [Gammaproteobacteria bacterium]MDC1123605.1 RnfH family protein [Gammaproteobacteria bacterium]